MIILLMKYIKKKKLCNFIYLDNYVSMYKSIVDLRTVMISFTDHYC